MTPKELLAELETMDFDFFMQNALERVPNSVDKREGSIIYDALAPTAYNMAEMVYRYHNQLLNTYTQTAVGEFLDYRAAERGIERKKATNCVVNAKFLDKNGEKIDVEIGNRFSSIDVDPIYYHVEQQITKGVYKLVADKPGNAANRYVGQILPVSNINDFGFGEITSIEIAARDDETDDSLRTRILESNDFTEYGGNVADYQKIAKSEKNIGAAQIYPTWNGGGTVKFVIVDNEFNIPTQTLIKNLQNKIDPTDSQGNGYGIAPIGHVVTVAAPSPKTLDFEVDVDLNEGISIADVRQTISDSVKKFIDKLKRDKWGTLKTERSYQLVIYRSQLMSELLKITDILNVSKIKINNAEKDVNLTFDNSIQELPIVGKVDVYD